MIDLKPYRVLVGFLILLLVFIISFGCASLRRSSVESEEVEIIEESEKGSLYYDFGDVLIHPKLKIVKKRSFVYHAPGFTAGVLGLSGRVDVSSLVRFFENNMAKDNWKLVCSFKSPRTVMFFTKANRSCIINITEKRLKSEVEIWVSPTMENKDATRLE